MPTRIDRLTDEQTAAMGPYARAWIDDCLAPDQSEERWERTLRGLRVAYELADIPWPDRVERYGSPRAMVRAAPVLAFELANGRPPDPAERRDVISAGWHRYYGGSLWSGAARRCFLVDVCGLELSPDHMRRLEAWRDLATGIGWSWPHRQFVALSARHNSISLDDGGQLHSSTGPSITWPDGWSLWHWHGIAVPRDWIESPESVDPALALTHPNVEQRRCLAEIVGWSRVLDGLPSRVIDADPDPEIGTLIEVDLPDSPATRFLRVRCGTGRDFALCVDGSCTTARQANAWTYGLSAEEYAPEVRT